MGWCDHISAGSLGYMWTVVALIGVFASVPSTGSELTEREEWYGHVDCPETFTVGWNKLLFRPPYVEKKHNSTHVYDGLFPGFLEMMLSECCRLSSKLVYNSSQTTDADLYLPVVVNLEADCKSNKQSNLVPMVPDTGIAFVVIKSNKSNVSLKMMKSLFATWPILILTLILSLIAGIIAWSLENRKNSENFPRTFVSGTWEGFWWAFISMTTVGYGDRCPQSVGGRLFAVLWILVGICVCSIFTAALTSSLTTISLETKIALPGTKVVALLDSIESTTGFRHQANLKRVLTARDIHEELDSGRVQGALMDAYFLVYFKQNYPTNKLSVQEVIPQGKLEYGVKVKNIELANCFLEKRHTDESALFEMAESTLTKPLSSGLDKEEKEESNIFDPQGFLFFPMLFTCLGVTAVLMVVGAAWELWHKYEDRRDRMTFTLKTNNWRNRTRRVKCYISQEKLQELENKIQDVSQSLDLIKNGMVFDKTFTSV